MSLSADDELRRLRARAYGPSADIDADPAAVERLRELEQRRADRANAETEADHEDDVDPVVRELLGSTTSAEGDEHPQLASVIERAPSRPRLSRLTKTLWIGSVAAAAALAAGIAVTVVGIMPVSASSGASQVAILEPTRTVTISDGWFGVDEVASVFEFHDVTLFTAGQHVPDSDRTDAIWPCLFVVPSEDVPPTDELDEHVSWSFSGPFIHTGCAVGRFSATVEVPLDDYVPVELSQAFPDARALQFVLDGDRVGVFLDDGD